MKKDNARKLATLTFIFAALLFGILIGRRTSGSDVSIDIPYGLTSSSAVSDTEAVPSQETAIPTGIKIDINTATFEELDALPGIGPVLAQAIIDFRDQNGAFKEVSELLNVSGLGEKKLNTILEYITVEE